MGEPVLTVDQAMVNMEHISSESGAMGFEKNEVEEYEFVETSRYYRRN